MEFFWHQLLCFFLQSFCLLFFIPDFSLLYYFLHIYCFLLLLFFFSFSSYFLPTFSFSSFSFCFCHSDFFCFDLHYFPNSSGHLVILTSLVFQSTSGLWQASHGIPKIILYFYPSIMSISVLSLYS